MLASAITGTEMALRDCGIPVTPGSGIAAAAEYWRETARPWRHAADLRGQRSYPMTKPKALVTRRWPEPCEAKLQESFEVTFNRDDHPMTSAELRRRCGTTMRSCPP